jgi:short-subunit dehydrogenase
VTVTVLAPGASATGFAEVASQRDTAALRRLMIQPRLVAEIGIRALLRRRASVVAGVWNNLIVLSNRVTPRRIQRMIMRQVLSGKK